MFVIENNSIKCTTVTFIIIIISYFYSTLSIISYNMFKSRSCKIKFDNKNI